MAKPTTAITHCEHENLSCDDATDWHMSHFFALRAMLSAVNLLNQSADDLINEVVHHEEPYLECIAALKMLEADEVAALRRARFAARAREALTEALAARNDPRTRELMQREIDFTHVTALPATWPDIANTVRIVDGDGSATFC